LTSFKSLPSAWKRAASNKEVISTAPTEILLRITDQLELRDTANLRVTCRSLYNNDVIAFELLKKAEAAFSRNDQGDGDDYWSIPPSVQGTWFNGRFLKLSEAGFEWLGNRLPCYVCQKFVESEQVVLNEDFLQDLKRLWNITLSRCRDPIDRYSPTDPMLGDIGSRACYNCLKKRGWPSTDHRIITRRIDCCTMDQCGCRAEPQGYNRDSCRAFTLLEEVCCAGCGHIEVISDACFKHIGECPCHLCEIISSYRGDYEYDPWRKEEKAVAHADRVVRRDQKSAQLQAKLCTSCFGVTEQGNHFKKLQKAGLEAWKAIRKIDTHLERYLASILEASQASDADKIEHLANGLSKTVIMLDKQGADDRWIGPREFGWLWEQENEPE
jgi:hypothetical protein